MNRRLIGTAIGLAVAVPAIASATPTIRVEGGSANVIPLTPVPRSSAPVTVSDTTDTDTLPVAGNSATAQLARATLLYGRPLGFDLFTFGGVKSTFVTQIGPDKMPSTFSPSWRIKVNHAATSTGSDTTTLTKSDTVLWSYESTFDAPELDLTVSPETVKALVPYTITVTSYDNAGKGTPAAGAMVQTDRRNDVAPASGALTRRSNAVGPHFISATLAGATRSQRRLLCITGAVRRPCSAILFPANGTKGATPRVISGLVARVGKATPQVSVTIARIGVKGTCRFLVRSLDGLSPKRPCGSPVTIPVTVDASGAWALTLPKSDRAYGAPSSQGLPAGRYLIASRARFAGIRETATRPQINTVRLTVAP